MAGESEAFEADAEMMVAIANGDRIALARLYDSYAGLLMAVGMRVLGDRRETEDLLHDVLLEVWRQAGDYDRDRGTVRTWLCIRMRSRAIDRRKSPRYSKSVSLESRGETAASDDPSRAPDVAAVRRALANLSEEQRVVIELGYFAGLSSSEIAERVDIPVGTVKSRVAAALAKLRVGLIPAGGAQ